MDRFDDPKNYRQKRESFTRSLQHFHETRGTPFRRIPQFCGKEVDLFRLYNVVTQRGGWIKVNRTNQWEELLEDFNIPKDCVNGGNALKQIYLRYLDRYEKVHYLGESGDRHDEEEDIESRHRRWSARSMHTVPLTYNYHQHIVVDNLRKFNGLSSDIYKASDYDRLALSLVSPLPNEQDFAINVCTILASEGKHTLKLEKCPRIMDYLLAHAGVYNHTNLRELFEEIYGSVRGHSLTTFWSDVIETKELLDLTDETRFIKKPPRKLKVIKVVKSSEYGTNSNQDNPPNIPQSYCATPKKSDRTIAAIEAPSAGETKENSTMDVRISESSDNINKNNSIEDSLNVENQGVCNSINNNVKTVLGADKIETNVLIDLTDNDSKVKNDGCEGGSENKGDTCLKVQEKESTNNDIVCLNNETNDVVVTNLPEKPESDSVSEVKNQTANDNPSSSMETTTTEGEKIQEVTGSEEVKVEDVVMETEEERIQREKELAEKLERERIEAEERRKKEEEEAEERRKKEEAEAEERRKKEEEEARIRAIEEAKRIEKETKEAEIYEAMLLEEEKKKKPYLYEEVPAKRPRRTVQPRLKIEPEDMELFCLGRENGTRDYVGQRVLQVANIFRDLTFCEESVPLMAKNTTFLRFLLLCANSKWSCLHQLGLDMLGNISPELTIEDPAIDRIFQAFFWTVYRGIHHSNRFMVLSCLEILNKICQKDENEDIVSRNLDQNIYDQICRLLTLHDVMILLYTLECLYSMSSMGEKACTFICRSKGAMEMLLAFVTVEAQYYGKEGCILMKVIETRPRGEPVNPPPVQPPPSASPGPGPPFPTTVIQNTPQSFPSMVTTSTMTVQQAPVQKIFTPNIIRTPAPKAMVGVPMAAVATPVQLPPNACPPLVQTMPSVQQQHAHQQTVQENEQFALAWLRATFELSAGGKVEQQDLYKRYVDSCAKMGRKGVIAAMHFPRFVRSVFGGTVGPKSHPIPASEQKPGGPISQSFYEGIKVRDVPLTINIKLVPVTEVPRPVVKKRPQSSTPKPKARRKKPDSPTSPILKAQLISPSKPSSPSPSPSPSPALLESKTQVSTQTHLSQALLGQSTSPPSTPPPMDNSTLIKSLLASKVSELCMTAPVGMLDNTQVTQRQQQQQQAQQQQQQQQQQQAQQQQKILQQQLQTKPAETPIKGRLVKINGVIQESTGPTPENHLVVSNVKGKKEPPQPPTSSTATTLGNLLRPKTPKLDGEDSDSMASTSRDCTTTGGGNVSSADDNDNSLTSFEGMFNGIQESLDFDATVSSVVEENCVKKSSNEDNVQKPNDKLKSTGTTADGNHLKQPDNKSSMTEGNCVKPPPMPNKSLMLADLLDKKDSPALNGVLGKDLRIGEKGLELVEKAILKETHLNNKDISVNCKKDTVVSVNGDTRTGGECVTVINNDNPTLQSGSKRTANEVCSDETDTKRPRIENETKDALEKKEIESEGSKKSEDDKKKDEKEEVNGEEEVRASSTAANLFAALAAEALEDETDLEVPSEPNPQPQTVMVPGGQIRNVYLGDSSPLIGQIIMAPGQLQQGQVQLGQRQVLFSTGGQSLPVIVQNQRIVQGSSGQMIVTSQPQQYIMSGNMQSQMVIAPTQTALVQGQTQTVLVASATPQQPGTKTIIILQPQSQNNTNSQQQKMMVTSQGPQMVVTQVPRQVVQTQPTPPPTTLASSTIVASSSTALRDSLTTDVVLNSGIQNNPPVPPLHQNGSQIQVISSGVQNNAPILNQSGGDKSKAASNNVTTVKTVPGAKSSDEIIFLCEWRGCMRSFKTANEVYLHVCNTHVPRDSETETQCLWERCDGMKRKRFSLMTHLSDRHCNPVMLTMMAERRRQLSTQGRSDIPAPVTPPAHPGHPPNAAFVAIARNAREFGNPKELMKTNGGKVAPLPPPPPPPAPAPPPPPSAVLLAKAASPPVQVKDDVEGPVTKSIRLTASLILRNLVIYSSIGRRFLKGYEPHLANIALSNVESSRTIAQVLADLNDTSTR